MSTTRSASTGRPYLKPKDMTVARSSGSSSPANWASILARSSCTLRLEVSITRSASPRSSRSRSRSAAMPSTMRPSPWRGCGRRTDSKRRTRASSEDSRKTIRRVTLLGVQVGEGLAEVVEEPPAADVDDDGDPRHVALGAGAELHHGGDQRGRQVVDDEPAEVLQTLGGRDCGPAPDMPEMITSSGMAASAAVSPGSSLSCPYSPVLRAPSARSCSFVLGRAPARASVRMLRRSPARSSSSMISPVAVFTAGAAGAAWARAAATVSAVLRPMPGTSQICSIVACSQPLHRAEMLDQRLLAGLAEAGHGVQRAGRMRLARLVRW